MQRLLLQHFCLIENDDDDDDDDDDEKTKQPEGVDLALGVLVATVASSATARVGHSLTQN